jgi:hypothetical protein
MMLPQMRRLLIIVKESPSKQRGSNAMPARRPGGRGLAVCGPFHTRKN